MIAAVTAAPSGADRLCIDHAVVAYAAADGGAHAKHAHTSATRPCRVLFTMLCRALARQVCAPAPLVARHAAKAVSPGLAALIGHLG